MANYTQLETYWKKLASESDRMKLVSIGKTEEGREQYMAIITSPDNIKNLDQYKQISQRLAHAEGLTDEQAHDLARGGQGRGLDRRRTARHRDRRLAAAHGNGLPDGQPHRPRDHALPQ